MKRCKSVTEIVTEAMRIVAEDRASCPDETDAEYFFRGESMNYHHRGDETALLETDFPCYLYQNQGFIDHERDLYQEALRYNVISFEQDKTVVDRLTRMQHYRLPIGYVQIHNEVKPEVRNDLRMLGMSTENVNPDIAEGCNLCKTKEESK